MRLAAASEHTQWTIPLQIRTAKTPAKINQTNRTEPSVTSPVFVCAVLRTWTAYQIQFNCLPQSSVQQITGRRYNDNERSPFLQLTDKPW